MNSISNIITTALLIIIAITLVLIWRRMPPTVAEFNAAKGVDRTTLSMKQPVVEAVEKVSGQRFLAWKRGLGVR